MAKRWTEFLSRAAVPKAGLGNLLVNGGAPAGGKGPKVATRNVNWQSPGQPQILDQDAQQFGEDAYLGQVYVMRCVQTIANTIAGLEFRAGINPNDPQTADPTAPLCQLLGPATPQAPGGPNPELASRAMWAWTICQYIVYGRFGWECQLASAPGMRGKQIVGLWPLVAAALSAVPSQGGGRYFDSYIYTTPMDGDVKMTKEQLIYAWRPSLTDPRVPETVLSAAKMPIYIAKGLDKYMVKLLENDMVASTLVVTPPFDEPSARRAWSEQFNTSFSGVDNAGKVIFAEAEYDEDDNSGKPLIQVEKIAQTALDAELSALSQTAKDEICLVPGTGIITKRGVVPVERVVVGDEVVTHKGRWRKVLNTQVRPVHHPVIELRANGLTPIQLTTNHNVFAAEYRKTHADTRQVFKGVSKVPAGELRSRGRQRRHSHAMTIPKMEFNAETGVLDVSALNILGRHGNHTVEVRDGNIGYVGKWGNDIPSHIKMTPALGRLLGLYLAEGSSSDHQVLWALHEDERDLQRQIADDVMEVFGLSVETVPVKGEKCTYVRLSSVLIVPIFKCGTARNKVIPEWAWDGDEEFLREVLWGWSVGDGCDDGQNIRGFTSSESLAWGMRLIAISLGHRASLQHIEKRPDSYIDGRLLQGGEGWQLLWQTEDRKASERHGNIYRFESGNDVDVLTSPLREVVDVPYDGLVYNFHVEEDTSYLTVGGSVANCVALGVPLSLIGNAKERIFANASSEYHTFWTMTVINLISELQDHINNLLAPRLGQEVGWFDLSRVEALKPAAIFAPPMIGDVINFGVASAAQVANVLGIPAADDVGAEDVDTVEIGEMSSSTGAGENTNRSWAGTRVTKNQLIEARMRYEQRPLNTSNWQQEFRASEWLVQPHIRANYRAESLLRQRRALPQKSSAPPELAEVIPMSISQNSEADAILQRVAQTKAKHEERLLTRRVQESEALAERTRQMAVDVRAMALAERTGNHVHQELAKHYPESTLGWVDDADWDGPKQVSLDDINLHARPGGRDPKKVQGLMKAVVAGVHGAIAPVVLVKTPSQDKYQIADGYHRTKAHEKLGHESVHAYVAKVDEDEGPWTKAMHDAKLNRAQQSALHGPDREEVLWFGPDGLKETLTEEDEEKAKDRTEPRLRSVTQDNAAYHLGISDQLANRPKKTASEYASGHPTADADDYPLYESGYAADRHDLDLAVSKRNGWLPNQDLTIDHCAYCGQAANIVKQASTGPMPLCNSHASENEPPDSNDNSRASIIVDDQKVHMPHIGLRPYNPNKESMEDWLAHEEEQLLMLAQLEEEKESA